MLIEQIKSNQLASRKARSNFRTGVLTTLLGEAQKIGKDDGGRPTTDIECTKVIKKFIKNIKDTLVHKPKNSNILHEELLILSEFLPQETSDDELRSEVKNIIESNPSSNIGSIMKSLRSKFKNFDGKSASTIIKEEL